MKNAMSFTRMAFAGSQLSTAPKAPLRQRNAKMDAMVKHIANSDAFSLDNALKAVEAALEQAKAKQ